MARCRACNPPTRLILKVDGFGCTMKTRKETPSDRSAEFKIPRDGSVEITKVQESEPRRAKPAALRGVG